MLGRARNFFFGSSAAPEGPPEAPPEAKKRRGGAAPVSLMRLPDDALVSACAYLGLVDGACAAVTCRRLAAVGRRHHMNVLIVHKTSPDSGRLARTLILDSRWRLCAPCPTYVEPDFLVPVTVGGEFCCVTFPFRLTLGAELQLPLMYVYSLKTNSWRTIDHFAHLGALTSFGCCALGDELCFVGGMLLDTDDPSAMTPARASVRTLNLQSGAWTRLADMPISIESTLWSCACCGKLYVLGNKLGNWGAPVLQIYDPTRRAWTRGPNCGEPMWCTGIFSAGKHIFCSMDQPDGFRHLSRDQPVVFDTETCTWSERVNFEPAGDPVTFVTTHQETLINIVMWDNRTVKVFALERVGPSIWAWREIRQPFPTDAFLADVLDGGVFLSAGFGQLRA